MAGFEVATDKVGGVNAWDTPATAVSGATAWYDFGPYNTADGGGIGLVDVWTHVQDADAGPYQWQGGGWSGSQQPDVNIVKATPAGAFSAATKIPQSGATYTVAGGDLNATFANPYSTQPQVVAPTGAITYSIAPGSPNGTSGSAVGVGTTLTAGLTYTIRASIAPDGNYNAGFIDSNWTVGRGSQSIAWSSAPSATYAGGSATFSATGAASGSYVWSISPAGPTGISGNGPSQTILFPTGGSFTVSVYAAANVNYNQSSSIGATMTVDVLPTVSGSFSPNTINYGQSSTFTFSATQGSTPLTVLTSMYWTGSNWATVPGTSYNFDTTWPSSYPNDTTAFLYSSSTFVNESASGSSATKSFMTKPKFVGASNSFGVWAVDTSGVSSSSINSSVLTVNKATPSANFLTRTLNTVTSTYTVLAVDLNATFANPYDTINTIVPSGTVTYAITAINGSATNLAITAGTTQLNLGSTYTVRASYPGDTRYNATTVTSTWTIASGDSVAPSVPTGLAASTIANTLFTLNWTASTDNVAVTGYEVFRDGISVGTLTGTSLLIPYLLPGSTYSMTVKARDAVGNWSAPSTALSVLTTSDPTADFDGDGIPDVIEKQFGTNPSAKETVDSANTMHLKINRPLQ